MLRKLHQERGKKALKLYLFGVKNTKHFHGNGNGLKVYLRVYARNMLANAITVAV